MGILNDLTALHIEEKKIYYTIGGPLIVNKIGEDYKILRVNCNALIEK